MSKALKVREALDKAWKGTKTIENKYNPLDWAAKGAAHTAEFLVPQSQEEALFELMTLGQGKKIKLGSKLLNKTLIQPTVNKLQSNLGKNLATVNPAATPGLKINPNSNPNVLFSKTREANKGVLNPQGVPVETTKGYQKLQNIQIDPETGRPLAKTATHHMSGIADSTAPLKARVDGDRLLQSAKKEGIPVGDELTNYISLPDVLTKGTRVSKVQQLAEQFPKINRRSISDALGASEFSKQPLLKSDEIADRRIWQGVKEQTGLKNPYGEFKPGSTQGPFPSIKLFDANNKLVREWKPTTLKEWGTRWDVINKHYGSNITQDVVNKVKVNPRLNTYGADHKLVHDTLKEVDSFKDIQTLMKEGKWSTIPFKQADVMYKKMLRDQHKVAINMANWRYGKIAEYFKKLNPNKVFSRLSPGEQAAFFKRNISEISSLGSLKELPTKKQLLKNTNFGFKDMVKSNKRRDVLEAIFGLKSPVGDLRMRK
tara:strand:- start:2 stop:1456 length:1455 start_codon:yes stop_codon:yes gene_type:complete